MVPFPYTLRWLSPSRFLLLGSSSRSRASICSPEPALSSDWHGPSSLSLCSRGKAILQQKNLISKLIFDDPSMAIYILLYFSWVDTYVLRYHRTMTVDTEGQWSSKFAIFNEEGANRFCRAGECSHVRGVAR